VAIETIPKLADVKLLREISKVIITPMLIVAVLNQTDFEIFGLSVDTSSSNLIQVLQFSIVFLVTSAIVGVSAWAVHDLMIYLQFFTRFIGIAILSTLFLAFGFLGVVGENPLIIRSLDVMWFYTSFVCGFYLLARADEIEEYFS